VVQRLSLFRTPTSQLAVNGGSQHPDKRKAGGHGPTLADEVEHLLPTPGATESGGVRAVPGKRTHGGPDHGPRLRDVVPALLPTPMRADGERASASFSRGNPTLAGALLPTPQVADVTGGHRTRSGDRSGELLLPGVAEFYGQQQVADWGPYARAVLRWAQVTGTLPPHPVEPGRTGMRLSPAFVEWMQGLPAGWVTGVPGLSRNAQLKALGNGVVPQQAFLALAVMLSRVSELCLSLLTTAG
jgi:hypothetical protein